MHIELNALKQKGLGIGLPLLAALLLADCGGGRDGAAVNAFPQTVSFGAAPALALLGTATVSATASSGLAVSYSSVTPSVCTVDENSGAVTNLAVGTCIIAADQSGNADFAPAAQVMLNLAVVVDPAQSVSFAAAPSVTLYGHAVVSATATSGLAVSYSSTTPAICSVNGGTGEVTSAAAGDCIIAADQAGNAYYNVAPQVTQTMSVAAWSGPLTAPGAPSGIAATAGTLPNTVTVSFVGPASSGGSPVTGYTVSSNPGGFSATGTASPVTVTCPSSCTGYAFAVQATNGIGDGTASAAAHVLTRYNVTATFYEPDTQPNDSIFTGSFTFDSTAGTVSGLSGNLSESMTGPPMTQVPLTYQLSSVPDESGGLLVTAFALNSTNTFAEGGFAPGSTGLYYGYPSAPNPAGGGAGNAYVTIYVNLSDPAAALTFAQIQNLAYADCAAGGMMGDVCMTGYTGVGTMGGYPVSQTTARE